MKVNEIKCPYFLSARKLISNKQILLATYWKQNTDQDGNAKSLRYCSLSHLEEIYPVDYLHVEKKKITFMTAEGYPSSFAIVSSRVI